MVVFSKISNIMGIVLIKQESPQGSEMGLTWNPDFVKSPAGMAQAGQVVFAFVGGIVNIFSGDGLLGFAFWDAIQ